MTKYATLSKYQPYIDIIRKDLDIPKDFVIMVKFRPFRGVTGGFYRHHTTWGEIALNNRGPHGWTVKSLMHEFMHAQQYIQGRLDWQWNEAQWKNGRRVRNTGVWMQVWKGDLSRHYGASKNPKIDAKYMKQPWEIEARGYEEQVYRLFPGLTLTKDYLGKASDGTKFYKVRK